MITDSGLDRGVFQNCAKVYDVDASHVETILFSNQVLGVLGRQEGLGNASVDLASQVGALSQGESKAVTSASKGSLKSSDTRFALAACISYSKKQKEG